MGAFRSENQVFFRAIRKDYFTGITKTFVRLYWIGGAGGSDAVAVLCFRGGCVLGALAVGWDGTSNVPLMTQARFALFTYCEPLSGSASWGPGILIQQMNLGLTEKSVQAAIESRLRSARAVQRGEFLFSRGGILSWLAMLSSQNWGSTNGYRTHVQAGQATSSTWQSGSVGIHGDNARYIRSAP